jgi:anti-sigma B factor antagonist
MFSVRINIRDCPGHVTIALHGELDLVDASDVAATLVAASSRQALVIVNLAGLTFIDASGVSALARGRDYARDRGGELLMSAPTDQVRKMLGMTVLAEAFLVPPGPARGQTAPGTPRTRRRSRLGLVGGGACDCFSA